MMYRYLLRFLISIAVILFVWSCVEDRIATIAGTVEKVKATYAPDGRTAIFDITFVTRKDTIVLEGETTEIQAIDVLRTKLDSMNVAYKTKIRILPDPNDSLADYGLVRNSVANIRAWSSHRSELSTQATMGTPVKILDYDPDGWYKIQTPDRYIGWIDEEAIIMKRSEELEMWKKGERRVFTDRTGWIEDTDGRTVSDIAFGSIVTSIEADSERNFVELPDGRRGYLPASALAPFNSWAAVDTFSGEEIISVAQTYLGVPYLWGGTSAKGFDCSGYTKNVFQSFGINLQRDASQQVKQGIKVDKDTTFQSLKPGDLFFFGKERKGQMRTTHVAIHMGDGKIIHATGRVRIESLNRDHADFNKMRFNTWHSVRRIIGADSTHGLDFVSRNSVYQ